MHQNSLLLSVHSSLLVSVLSTAAAKTNSNLINNYQDSMGFQRDSRDCIII